MVTMEGHALEPAALKDASTVVSRATWLANVQKEEVDMLLLRFTLLLQGWRKQCEDG
jgi:hypothetical protein